MAVAGMHIRHDWQGFVDWDQKSVRTLCGKTSARHLAGIPGVTDQPDVIEVNNKKVYGWCTRCSVSAFSTADAVAAGRYHTIDIHPYILPMYEDVRDILGPVNKAWWDRHRRF